MIASHSLQENLITLLAYDDEQGKIVARMIDANLFEGDKRVVAERCIEYWHKHGQAPKVHTPDLFADILEEKNRRAPAFIRILRQMNELSEGTAWSAVLH